ncbi:MAG: rhomboid family intramembrane serine protease [Pseudomonadota bacterium]
MSDENKNNPWGGEKDNNVIDLRKKQKEREDLEKKLEKELRKQNEPPIINLPPLTKYMLLVFASIFITTEFIVPTAYQEWAFMNLGFVPGRFTGNFPFNFLQFITPITHMMLHGSWLHLIMNSVMLLAFGSGIEKWLGSKNMLIIFVLSGLFGMGTHFVIYSSSIYPVVGASGGLSGLFAAALIMLQRQNMGMNGRYGIWPFIFLWIGISVIFGMMGGPDGSTIAWAAHIGGFLGGFLALKLLKI